MEEKKIITPNFYQGKCRENCSHKDSMGFCTAGDACIKYGVNNVTGRPLSEETSSYIQGNVTLMEVQNMLGQAMRDLMNKKLPAKERQEARDTARELSALAKQLMSGFGITLNAYKLMTSNGIDANGIKGLIE